MPKKYREFEKRFVVYFKPDQLAAVQRYAAAAGLSASGWVRHLALREIARTPQRLQLASADCPVCGSVTQADVAACAEPGCTMKGTVQ